VGASALLAGVPTDPKIRRQISAEHYLEKARALFREISREPELGPKEAMRIFANFCSPPSKSDVQGIKKRLLLDHYDEAGRPADKTKFAREMIAKGASYWFDAPYSSGAIVKMLNRYDQNLRGRTTTKKRKSTR
jgi:hypothetical protein